MRDNQTKKFKADLIFFQQNTFESLAKYWSHFVQTWMTQEITLDSSSVKLPHQMSTVAGSARIEINICECIFNGVKSSQYSSVLTVYPKKHVHGFVVLCFVVVMQSFIMNSHEVFIHIHQGCFAGTGAIVRLPQCQWSKPDGYGKISQCITTTKHSKAKTVCIFLGIYCIWQLIFSKIVAQDFW